jgi:trimeric autotransporter adhesin
VARISALFLVLVAILPWTAVSAIDSGSWSESFYRGGPDGSVQALLTTDDGLIVGGDFTAIGNIPAPGIARFDGTIWTSLGTGIPGTVRALIETQGGLVAAGSFVEAGGVPARNVAFWDGAVWHAMGAGIEGSGRCLAFYDGALVAGGGTQIVRWDGAGWQPLGAPFQDWVRTLAVFRGELYAGSMATIDDGSFGRTVFVWRWDGSEWKPLTSSEAAGGWSSAPEITSLAVVGDRLYACGNKLTLDDQTYGPAYWDGEHWNQVDGWAGTGGWYEEEWVSVVLPYHDQLLVGGSFWGYGGGTCHSISLCDGSNWSPLQGGGFRYAEGLEDEGPNVSAMAIYRDEVYVSGDFAAAGSIEVPGFAKWNGTQWREVVPGGMGLGGQVEALTFMDSHLIAGGWFAQAGPTPAAHVAEWTGSEWRPMGPGLRGRVWALIPYNGGLVAGGDFTTSGDDPASDIARWDGAAWRPLGSGIHGAWIACLAVYDGELVAAGHFDSAGGTSVRNIARWDGTEWQPLGEGRSASVFGLTVFQGRLYAVGDFPSGLANWDGDHWTDIGHSISRAFVIASDGRELLYGGYGGGGRFDGTTWSHISFTDYRGDIYAIARCSGRWVIGGRFWRVDDRSDEGLLAFDGETWTPFGGGIPARVNALAGNGIDLAVGGRFGKTRTVPSGYLAIWRGIETPVAPFRFEAVRSPSAVEITIKLAQDGIDARYIVYRARPGGERSAVSGETITGQVEYTLRDSTPPHEATDYWLEQVTRMGEHLAWFGPVSVASTDALWPLGHLTVGPNPTSGQAWLQFELPRQRHTKVRIMDAAGRLVAVPYDDLAGPGPCIVEWDGTGKDGARLPSGSYAVELTSGPDRRTARVLVVR